MRLLLVVAMLVACGDNVRTIELMPDAYVPDAPPDASPVYPSCFALGCPVPTCGESGCACHGAACSPTGIPIPDAD